MKRVVTALLLIPFFCYIVLWAPQLGVPGHSRGGGGAVLSRVCAIWRRCTESAKPGLFGYAAGLLLLLLPGKDGAFVVLIAILAMSLALRSREMAQALPDAAALLLGVVYVFGSLRCARRIARHQSVLALLCACRSTGRATSRRCMWAGCFGRHKLAPNVSPAKSWEGAIASTVASVIYGAFYFPLVAADRAAGGGAWA